MQEFFFFLGHTPDLSLKEIRSLIDQVPQKINPSIVSLELSPNKLQFLSHRLAGVKKIAEKTLTTNPNNLLSTLKKTFLDQRQKNLALTNYAKTQIKRSEIKELKSQIQKRQAVRFLSFDAQPHSLVALRKQNVFELNLLPTDSGIKLAETIWIQNADLWHKKDVEKPFRDISSGMISPKLARTMVNLATKGKKTNFADPFCGTGTIAIEALLLGNKVFASDISQEAIQGTKENLAWLVKEFQLHQAQYQAFQLDATHLNEKLDKLETIATEPYLGPLIDDEPKISRENLKNQILGIHKLLKGSLKSWFKILPKKGRVVVIFPEFHLFQKKHTIPLIDTCENLGYNKVDNFKYQKSQTKVIRNITILEKNGKNKTVWKN